MKINTALLFIAITASLLFSACGHTTDNSYHLPQKTMQKLLLDVNVAEAYCIVVKDSLHRPGTKNIDSLSVFYKNIFAHYNITETQFEQSLDWYKNHPDELDSIYNNNIKIIKKWQEHQFDRPTPLSKTDSAAKHDTLTPARPIPVQRNMHMTNTISAKSDSFKKARLQLRKK